jgi:hypothetical protein
MTSQLKKPELSKKLQRKLALERAQELEDQRNERARLEREIKYSKKSVARGKKDWESWCETNVRDGLREQVQVTKESIERLKDRSEHAIKITFEHKKHADEQYERNLQSHLEIIDHLTGINCGCGFNDDELYKICGLQISTKCLCNIWRVVSKNREMAC